MLSSLLYVVHGGVLPGAVPAAKLVYVSGPAPAAYYAAGPAPIAVPSAYVASAKIEEAEHDANPNYSFAYEVQDHLTGDSKSQHETRNGDRVVGQYSLAESDGTKRIVDYTADDENGFNAVVRKEPLPHVAVAAAPAKIIAAAPVAYAAAPVPAPAKIIASAPVAYSAGPAPIAYSTGPGPFAYSAGPAPVAYAAAPIPAPAAYNYVSAPYTSYVGAPAAPITSYSYVAPAPLKAAFGYAPYSPVYAAAALEHKK